MNGSNDTRVTRRFALECMSWAGAGLVWTVAGGVPAARLFGEAQARTTDFTFVQISDSHIGFIKPANPDPAATLQEAVASVAAAPGNPAFLIHTGDITHTSKPQQFDDAARIIGSAGLDVHYVPGEHDMEDAGAGQLYLARHGAGTKGRGWYAFDQLGVHFIALVNVSNVVDGVGHLGAEQLAWLAGDLKFRAASTPIVVFAHIPLWAVYQDWGWTTDDSLQALKLLRRFGSVTVLNGHVHQIFQKVEGNVAFHTARSTAFPQGTPGKAPAPGPMLMPAGRLRTALGITRVTVRPGRHALAVTDTALADA
jgi:hypothetical protein